ncbi:uncharacterized protein LOC128920350 [Zeugodacus cucurbitae]|uniref:uncharacterized protein LOC128920350 n=1 Tax=Zeugodacus cucurbitae TaxID=28588 RepID=UPI0023D955E0|nr:uncharacterized protein LOC128920350 [Zeugodacus cucurbitae]
MNGGKMINNQNNFEVEEPRKKFRPWEDRAEQNENTARPNLVESPPAPYYFDYWTQLVERTAPWINRYMPYCFLAASYPATAVWHGGATTVPTPVEPQLLSVNTPAQEATSPTPEAMAPKVSQSRTKRKREEEDEDEEDRLKAKRDEHLMKRISKLSREQIEEVLPYHPEMARKYPPKERTPAEQRRRDKNTEACRMSRRRKKLMEIMKEFPGACGM